MNRNSYLRIFNGTFSIALVCLAVGFLASCGSSGSNITPPPVINITANTGYTASAAVGTSFGTLSATVTTNGSPTSGVTVTFTAPSSGASGLFATTPAAVTDTETTNASGIATSQIFTANSTTGSYSVTASTTGATTPASFALTNAASAPTIAITEASGSSQSAQVGTAFAAPLVANVTSNGTPLNGATVTFAAPSSGASCALSATTGITDASGNVSVTCTANTTAGGPYNVTASTSGATTSANFALTNTASTPPPTIAIAVASGSPQSAQVGTAFAAPLVANVTSNGTALSGATVTFAAPASGASCALSAITAITDVNGNASVTCTANTTVGGPYNVTASTSGATTSASFALTNTASPTIAITAASGSPQSTQVGTAFAAPLVANVTSNGTALSGATVTFAAPASGASCVLSATTATTNASGNASVTCTANTTAGGPYNVTASTSGAATSAGFALTNTASPTIAITAASGSGQSTGIGTAFAAALVANVTSNGTALSGATVTFAAPASGASCALSATTATTDANGNASITCTANTTLGAYAVTASTSGATTPASFALTNTAGAAANLTATSGGGQTATVGTAFTNPLIATVTDAHSNPVSGVSVTFTAPASGASCTLSATTATTNSSGNASVTCTANTTAGGPYNVVASSTGLTSVNFAETNNAGAAAILTATSGGGQTTKIITRFANPLVATVTDAHNNPVSGVSVTFTAPASGASGLFQTTPPSTTDTELTGANGQATSQVFGANSIAGTYTVVATSGALTAANFTETNTAAAAANLTATSGGGQSATVNTAFTLPLVATATDGHGNPVSGVTVTFTAPASGASGLFATTPPATTDTVVTGSNGQATSAVFTANSTAGGPYNVVASSTGLTSVNFAETNTASSGNTLSATSGGGQSTTIDTPFANPLVATVTNGGNPVSGVSVTFTAPASGASGLFATTPPSTTDTEVTGANGQATSHTFGANATAGSYNVVASSTGLTSVNFAETNNAGAAANLAATSGGGQSATISTAFANPLVATVTDAHSNPVSGVSVTFTAPASGASGLFQTTPPATTDTEVTGSNGQATSHTFVANSTAGGPYNVVASSTGLTSVNFAETNTTGSTSSNTYVFYASGQDTQNGAENYYAIAGAVTINSSGTVTAGEQDYNDAIGGVSPFEPTPDTITGGTLTVDPSTGQGTLTLTTSNTGVGSPLGTEVFAVQFANTKHALIAEFDGWATSSGSLDLQTATTASSGTFAFALSGVDDNYNSVAYGGIYNTTSGVSPNVTLDINDDGSVKTAKTYTATASAPDAFGRSTITGITNPTINPAPPVVLASYVVGPEVMRLIDIDNNELVGTTQETTADAAVGSAYGQGSTTTFTNANFPSPSSSSGVFTVLGQWSEVYATLGEFTADSTNGTFSAGTADDNELDNGIQVIADSISGSTYDLVSSGINGYGSMTLAWGTAGPTVSLLGVYMVDPALDINDPNNTGSADVGGALIIDLDPGSTTSMPGGMGVITPQTKTTVASFDGTYVAGFQNFNNFTNTCLDCEIDMVSQGTMTSGAALSLTGDVSDLFGTWTGTPAESTGDTFTSTPLSAGTGIYSMSTTNSQPNPLEATIDATAPGPLDVDIYQASGTTLYWIETIPVTTPPPPQGVFLGPIEQFTGAPTFGPAEQTQPQPSTNTKPQQRVGGTLH